jgi:hypothetical protein
VARQCRNSRHMIPSGNGHGLTTYDRELKPGQVTRLGLQA